MGPYETPKAGSSTVSLRLSLSLLNRDRRLYVHSLRDSDVSYPYRALDYAGVGGERAATLTYACAFAMGAALFRARLTRAPMSWLLVDELLTLREWCGGAMIIAAGLLSDRLGNRPVPLDAASACSAATAARPD